ncbi:MAG: sulfatase [Puniceicoccaceae bacterium]|nr:MAG: sulfatase [Puniceicoccaceae bacterium]
MDRPNIVLLMTDQQRGDCLGFAGHPVLQTPHLDHLAARGCYFPRAYSAHPQCIPARRTMLTGRSARGHGVFTNYHAPLHGPTLPGELTRAGYQTHLCGKLHLHPERKLHGFMSADWADAPHHRGAGDYGRWLAEQGIRIPDAGMAHGALANGWVARPFHLPEQCHFTNWVTDRTLRFLERRDPTVPFFLNVSYHQPHQPCTPPQVYWDRYINADLPEPVMGDWVERHDYQPGLPVESWRTVLPPAQMRQFRAGYYGCINHIDDQIGRILAHLPRNTVVVFTSDHGEMLGDHQFIRKTRALEPSARIPFMIRFPPGAGLPSRVVRDEVVELRDLMPTLLDLAGATIPETVEGASLVRRLRGEIPWREWLHGEAARCGGEPTGMQFLTDGVWKYIWEPGLGRELFFHLATDPRELRNLAADPAQADRLQLWRDRLIETIRDFPEGFVVDGALAKLPGVTRPCIPELEARG